MKLRDVLLMIGLAAIWGFNFVPIRIGLDHVPPLTLTAMRFAVTVFPAIFFVKKPDIPLRNLIAYGVLMFAGQFSCMFTGIHLGLSAGLASLVLQMQAFFTIGLAALLLRERPKAFQLIGAAVAASGIVVVGFHVGGEVTTAGLLFALLAALSWSCGNLITKSFGKIDMFGVIIWGNLFALIPMVVLACLMSGFAEVEHSILDIHWSTLMALAYIAYASTFVGYSIWSHMLAHHPTAVVAPFTLLVPAFAMLSAALVLGEGYPLWKFEATVLILCGLAINQFGGTVAGSLGTLWRRNPEL